MNRFVQHVPTFCEVSKPEEIFFDDFNDLLKHARFQTISGTEGFYRWSKDGVHCLMAEFNHGYQWYFIGYIDNLNDIDLPIWYAKHHNEPERFMPKQRIETNLYDELCKLVERLNIRLSILENKNEPSPPKTP